VTLLGELLAIDGAHFDARWNRAWRYFDLDDYDAMLRDGELLTTLRPTSSTAWNIRGVALKQLRRLEESLQAFSKAIELSPENGATYLNRADVYRSLERYDLALADCNRAITLEPSFGGALALRGAVQIAKGLATAALKDCEAAIHLEPTNALAYWTRAQIRRQQDALDLAIEDFGAAADRDPDNADVLLDRGDAYRQLRRYELAEADYTASLDRRKNPDAFYKRGSVRVNLGALQGAREDLDLAIHLRPATAHYYSRRARVLRLMGEYAPAMADHDMAAALAPSVHDVYANRGITRWFSRDLAGAIEDFERAADFAGASRSTFHVWLWQLHTARGEAELAESAARAAAEFAVDEWAATIIRVIRGEAPPETLLSMAKDDGRLTDAYYYIGARALAGGDVSGAHVWFQKCVALRYVDFSEYDLAILHVSLTDTPELPMGGG
jgi:tetratricopeptide (TPR) repeat protein